MDVSHAMLSASRWAGFAQGTSVSSNIPAPAPDNNGDTQTKPSQTQTATPVASADTLTLSVKTVFRQQTSLSLELQKSDNTEDEDAIELVEKESNDEQEHDDSHANVTGSLSASISQSLFNVVSATRQSVQSDDKEADTTVSDNELSVDGGETTAQTTTVNSVSANRGLQSSLQLTTAEGDVVSVELGRSQRLSAGSASDENTTVAFAGGSSASQLSISINGELNEKESKAIEHVIKRVNQLAEKLFEGKVGAAFGKLQSLNVNSKQLSAIALDMSSSLSFTAVSAYSQVSTVADPEPDAPAPVTTDSVPANAEPATTEPVTPTAAGAASDATQPSAAEVVTPAVQEAGQVVEETADAAVFDNPFAEIRKLFTSIADSFAEMNRTITEQQNDFVKQLFNDVVDKVEAGREGEQDDDDEHHADAALQA